MLHVLRHYLPIRKALLIASETVILTTVVYLVMAAHLSEFEPGSLLARELGRRSLTPAQARWVVVFSSLMVAVLAQVAISFNELYDFRVSSSRYARAARFVSSAGIAVALVLSAVALLHVWRVERVLAFPVLPVEQRVVLLTFALLAGFATLYIWRPLFHLLFRHFNFNERVLILGAGEAARTLADEMLGRTESGYEIVGLVSGAPWLSRGDHGNRGNGENDARRGPGDDPLDSGDLKHRERRGRRASDGLENAALEVSSATTLVLERELGASALEQTGTGEQTDESLFELVRRLGIDTIAVSLDDRRGGMPTAELLRCRLDGVVVVEGAALYERIAGKLSVRAMRPSYLIFNEGFVQSPSAQLAKRLLDIALALLVLLFTWPLMLVTAIAVRMDSPGPVLFAQERTGRYGRPFTLLKFRSMRADAEKGTGPVWARANDPRITKVGRFIRKTRLDELPQLFNVLAGSMSMVGPRPERPHFVQELSLEIPYYSQRHIAKPGLTGWAQINYPYGNTTEDSRQKLQFDLFYIKHQSLLFDLSILATTTKTVVLRRGT